jgi:hypothetical protein
VAPAARALSTQIRPPWAWAILRQTDYVVVDSKDTRLATVTEKEIDKSDKDRPGHWKSVTRRGTDRL